MVTAEEIEAARTPVGGWTREQLAAWGVPWPPPKGWKRALLQAAPTSDLERQLRDDVKRYEGDLRRLADD